LVSLLTGVIALPAADQRPNVVLIVADDLGYGDLGCYGATRIKTPNIDRLAQEGVRCTDAQASAAVCQPSRYSILTGEYASRIKKQGIYQTYFREDQTTLPSLLRSAGYATAIIGKWHNGFGRGAEPDYNQPNFAPAIPGASAWTPLDIGFESFFGLPRSHNEPPSVFIETVQNAQGVTYLRVVDGDPADPIILHPTEKDPKKRRKDDHGHGFSTGAIKAHAARDPKRIDLVLTDHAVSYLQGRSADQPFFLYLPFNAPHVPIAPAPEFQGTSAAGLYGDFIQQLDACVGRITTTLVDRGLAQNTLLIVTSDNGGLYQGKNVTPYLGNVQAHLPNGSLQGQKTDCWEGGHRVPLIIRWPAGGIPAGTTCAPLIGLTDVIATVAAATGTPLPAKAARDSLDMLPLLKAPATFPQIRREMVIQGTKGYMLRSTDDQGHAWAFLPMRGTGGETVIDQPNAGQWGQLYRNLGFTNSDIMLDQVTGRGRILDAAPGQQLYDLNADVTQRVNVAIQYPEVTALLDARLKSLLDPNNH
jgi:arylsulfatase A